MSIRTVPLRGNMPKRTLRASMKILQRLGIRAIDVSLGGGTKLAALWGHRLSVDIDLSMLPKYFRRLVGSPNDGVFAKALKEEGGRNVITSDRAISWDVRIDPVRDRRTGRRKFPDGHTSISIDSLPNESAPPPAKEVEETLGIPLEENFWILRKKLLGRVLGREFLLPRDAHDLVVAARVEPDSLLKAMKGSSPEDAREIIDRIRREIEANPSWNGDAGSRRNVRIINPVHADLVDLNLWREFASLLEKGPEAYIERARAHLQRESSRVER